MIDGEGRRPRRNVRPPARLIDTMVTFFLTVVPDCVSPRMSDVNLSLESTSSAAATEELDNDEDSQEFPVALTAKEASEFPAHTEAVMDMEAR